MLESRPGRTFSPPSCAATTSRLRGHLGMQRDHDRRGDGRPDRRLPRRPARPRARRSTRSSDSATRSSRTPCRCRCRPDGPRHRRNRGRPVRHGERLDDVGDHRRGSGVPVVKHGNRAASSRVRLVRRADRARPRPDAARRAGGRDPRRDGHHLRLRRGVPPGLPARRARARRARHPDRVQLSSARSATRPAPRPPPSASPASSGFRSSSASSRPAARRLWCSAATTASTS